MFADSPQHPPKNVMVEDDMQQTEGVEVAREDQGEKGGQ